MIDLSALDKFPNVQKYIKEYIKNDGEMSLTRLPNLVIWFRETLEKNGVDVPEYFGWTEEWTEEFYSWGHNSRWVNVFMTWLEPDDIEEHLEEIADIAKEYGDPDIDKIYPIEQKDNKCSNLM